MIGEYTANDMVLLEAVSVVVSKDTYFFNKINTTPIIKLEASAPKIPVQRN